MEMNAFIASNVLSAFVLNEYMPYQTVLNLGWVIVCEILKYCLLVLTENKNNRV